MIEVALFLAQALAQPASTPTEALQPPPAAPKLICDSTPVMGSRIQRKRVCYTKEQYQRYKREIYNMLDRKQRVAWFQG